jgi:hypothetical protein
MKKYMLLYRGPATPPDASHAGWPAWFARAGDQLVSMGSPMLHGFALHRDGSQGGPTSSLNGYSIVQAADAEGVKALVKGHPFLAQDSGEFTIEVFEVPDA